MSNTAKKAAEADEAGERKIFIGGLNFSTDEAKLRNFFKKFGAVQDAVVMKDPVSKRSRGFGFITYIDAASVDVCIAAHPFTLDDRPVEAKRAVPRSEITRPTPRATTATTGVAPNGAPKAKNSAAAPSAAAQSAAASSKASSSSTGGASNAITSPAAPDYSGDEYALNKIFVGGLHYETRDPEFRKHFEQWGRVISAEVMFNRETLKSRGFGFIVFELESSAIKTSEIKEHIIDGKLVEVKRAIPRSKLPPGTHTPSVLKGGHLSATDIQGAGKSSSGGNDSNKDTTTRRSGSQEATTTATTTVTSFAAAAAGAGAATSSAVTSAGSAPISASTATISGTPSRSAGSIAPSTSGVRKPYNAVTATTTVPISSTRKVSGTSYAAALKLGGTYEGQEKPLVPAATAVAKKDEQLDSFGTSLLAPDSQKFQSLLFDAAADADPISGEIKVNKAMRSNSEPIVVTEGSSVLQGEILSESALSSRAGMAGTIKQGGSSNASSRSNSIIQPGSNHLDVASLSLQAPATTAKVDANGASLGNLPWLSSPPSNPLDPAASTNTSGTPASLSTLNLPTAMAEKPTTVATTASHETGMQTSTPGSTALSTVAPPGMNQTQQPRQIDPQMQPQFTAQQVQQQLQQMQQMHQLQLQQLQLQMAQAQMQQGGMMAGGLFLPPGGTNMFLGQSHFMQPGPNSGPQADAWAAMLSQQHGQSQVAQSQGVQQSQSGNQQGGVGGNNMANGQQMFAQQANFGMPQYPFYMDYMSLSGNSQNSAVGLGQVDPSMMFYGANQGMPGNIQLPFQQQQQQNALFNGQQQQQQILQPPGIGMGGVNSNSASSNHAGPTGNNNKGKGSVMPDKQKNETSEADDLFQFHELSLASPEFDPTTPWLPNKRN